MFVVLLPNVFHTNDMFALSEKSAEKKTKTGRLPIAHYKQKPADSDLWPVNRCIPSISDTGSMFGSHINLQPKTGCSLKLSRVEPGQYLDERPPGKTRLLLEEVLVRPAGGAHSVVCVSPNALV